MRSKREVVEYSSLSSRTDEAPELIPENQEWAWMVAEDPAFYLAGSGRAPESAGG